MDEHLSARCSRMIHLFIPSLVLVLTCSPIGEKETARAAQIQGEFHPFKNRATMSTTEGRLTEKEYLGLPEDDIDIAEGGLIIAKGIHPDMQVGEYLEVIDSFAVELGHHLNHSMRPQQIVETLNDYIFSKKGFGPKDIEGKSFLDTVIDEKGGNCTGLTCLYLALAQRLNIPLFAVAGPDHLFVRYEEEGTQINIEATDAGNSLTDEEIVAWLKVHPRSQRKEVFMTSLSKRDVLAGLLVNRGRLFDDQGDYQRALADYNASIALYPNNPTAYNNRGSIYAIQGRNDEALMDFGMALSLDPNYSKAYCGRGNVLLGTGEWGEALTNINEALRLNPRQADAYNSRGLVALQQQQYETALRDFSEALKLNKGYAEGYFNRSLTYSLMGRKREMLADLVRAFELDARLKQQALISHVFTKWREDAAFTHLFELTIQTGLGPDSSLKEFPLLYLYFNTFHELKQAQWGGQLHIAIHANDPRSKDHSIEEAMADEKVFFALYRDNLLRVKLDNGFEMFRSEEEFYWDRAVNPDKYSDELISKDEISQRLRKEADIQVKAIRARYGL
jgi:regulator of sirC expression with transglutaminase-like and TPR domain